MAFIKDTERAQLIKATNKNYLVKKLLLLVDIVALVAFVVMVFVSWYMEVKQGKADWAWFTEEGGLTSLGIGMLIFACAVVALGVVCVVLVFTIKSPKNTIKLNKKLESSALSGKRVYKTQTAGEVMKSRTTMKSNKKDKKKK